MFNVSNTLKSVSLLLALSIVTKAETIKIGVAWAGKSGMAKRVCAGFDKGIKTAVPDAEIEYNKELENVEELGKVIADWEKSKTAIVILRSNGAKYLGKNPPSKPTFIGACNNPVELGTLKNMTAPEGNITGVTYYLPAKDQFNTFKAIIPDMKSVVLLTEKGHPSSDVDIKETAAVCKSLGFGFKSVSCASVDDAKNAAKTTTADGTVILLGAQALLIDNTTDIIASIGKTPVLAYSSKSVEKGVFAGFVADDNKLGVLLATSVGEVLKGGKTISSVPVKVDPKPQLIVNITTMKNLGIMIPLNIMKLAKKVQ